MKRLGRSEEGFVVEPLSFAMLLLAAQMYIKQTQPFEEEMDVETFLKFQILNSVVGDITEETYGAN